MVVANLYTTQARDYEVALPDHYPTPAPDSDLIMIFENQEVLSAVESTLKEGEELFVVGGTAARYSAKTLDRYKQRPDTDIAVGIDGLKERLELALKATNTTEPNSPAVDIIDFRERLTARHELIIIALQQLRAANPEPQLLAYLDNSAQQILAVLSNSTIDSFLATDGLFDRESVAIRVFKENGKLQTTTVDNQFKDPSLDFKANLSQINAMSSKFLLLIMASGLPAGTVIRASHVSQMYDLAPRLAKELAEGTFNFNMHGDQFDPFKYLYRGVQRIIKGDFPFVSEKGLNERLLTKKVQEDFLKSTATDTAQAIYGFAGIFPLGNYLIPGLNDKLEKYHQLMGGNSRLKEILQQLMKEEEDFPFAEEAIKELSTIKREVGYFIRLWTLESLLARGQGLNNSEDTATHEFSISETIALIIVAFEMDESEPLDSVITKTKENWVLDNQNYQAFWSRDKRAINGNMDPEKVKSQVTKLRAMLTTARAETPHL